MVVELACFILSSLVSPTVPLLVFWLGVDLDIVLKWYHIKQCKYTATVKCSPKMLVKLDYHVQYLHLRIYEYMSNTPYYVCAGSRV